MPKTASIRTRTTPHARARSSRRVPVRAGRLTYTVVFEPAEEGGYVVTVPALPGCITQGDTFAEARAMAEEAILGYIEALQKLHEDIEAGRKAYLDAKAGKGLSPIFETADAFLDDLHRATRRRTVARRRAKK